MSIKIGYLDKKATSAKEIELNPTIFCDKYVNQGQTCPLYEQILKADIKVQGDYVHYLCMHSCSNFIKRDFQAILTTANF